MQLVKCAAASLSLILNFQKEVWIRMENKSFEGLTLGNDYNAISFC